MMERFDVFKAKIQKNKSKPLKRPLLSVTKWRSSAWSNEQLDSHLLDPMMESQSLYGSMLADFDVFKAKIQKNQTQPLGDIQLMWLNDGVVV